MNHTRFDKDHRATCEDCFSDYLDFVQEQAGEERLDTLAAEEESRYED